MKKTTISLLQILLSLTFLIPSESCKKEKHEDHEVSIKILSPSQGATVTNPFLLHINFNSDEEIHDIEVKIRKSNAGSSEPNAFEFSTHTHEKYFELKDSIFIPVSSLTTFELKAQAGEESHRSESKINFSIQP